MADKITTLHPENDTSINLYPNVKDENIPNTIARVSYVDEGDHENDLAISAVRADLDTEISDRKKDTSDTNGRIDGLATDISGLDNRVDTLEQKPACLPLTGGTLNGGLDVMGRLAVAGKVGQDHMLEVGEGVADSHLSIQANKSLYSRVFTPTNSAYTFAETMRDGVYEWTIESQSNGETKTATYRLPYGANMPTGSHFLALRDEVTAEATTRENADNALTNALGNKADYQELGNIWSLPEGATWRIINQNSVKIGKLVFTHLVIGTTSAVTSTSTVLAILNKDNHLYPNHAHIFPFANGGSGVGLARISNWSGAGNWDLVSYPTIVANNNYVDFETFFTTVL